MHTSEAQAKRAMKYYLLVTKKVAFPIKIWQNPVKIRLNPRIFLWISPHFDGFLQKKI